MKANKKLFLELEEKEAKEILKHIKKLNGYKSENKTSNVEFEKFAGKLIDFIEGR